MAAMRCVRVLLVLPRGHEADDSLQNLANSTLAALVGESRSEKQPESPTLVLPQEFEFDPTFGVVPLGPQDKSELDDKIETKDAISLFLEKSQQFVVRGFIDVPADEPIPKTLKRKGEPDAQVFIDLELKGHLTCGTSPSVGSTADVRKNLDVHTLAAKGLDGAGVAVALVDTGIQLSFLERRLKEEKYGVIPRPGSPPIQINVDPSLSWKPASLTSSPFQHPLDHGTMTAYDVLIAAPEATLLDYPMLSVRAPGDHSVRGTISAAMTAYAHLVVRWIFYGFFGLSKPPYSALVVNNSWGIYNPALDEFPPGDPQRYVDNPNHPFRAFTKLLTAFGYDIVFCAGNCGSDCPTPPCLHRTTGSINGASAYDEVLTVAGCDIYGSRVGYSSQGPSIRGMPQQKPDVTAYTHFQGSDVRARWLPDAGTSVSAPITSGCIAALRTKVAQTGPGSRPPPDMFDAFRQTAGGVWGPDYGFGIIDPVAVGRFFGVI
jgi:Subtilase family